MSAATAIPAMLHPFSPFGQRRPERAWAAVRAAGPVYDDPVTGLHLLTRYALCRAALTDPAFSAAGGQQQRARDDDLPASMLTTDGVEHRRLREALSGHWSGRAVHQAGAQWAAVARDSLPDRADGLELVADFAAPFAERVLAGVLGLPDSELPEFAAKATAAAPNLDPLLRGPAASAAVVASGELQRYLVDRSRAARAAGAATDLADLDWDAPLTEPERVAYWSLLVVGGLEPLIAAVAGTVWMLLEHPEALAAVTADPVLIPAAVEETLRLHSPIPFTARVCSTDVHHDSGVLLAGTPVLAVICAANRDPDVFPDPDTFRLDRPRTPAHLAFGGGAHFCLGAPLVRVATAAAVEALLSRHPHLTQNGGVSWTTGSVPRRLQCLPVSGTAPEQLGTAPESGNVERVVPLGRSLSNLPSEVEGALRALEGVMDRPARATPALPAGYTEQTSLSQQQVRELVERYEGGDSMRALAGEFRVHRTKVRRLLDQRGIEVRDEQIRLSGAQLEEMAELYRGGWSMYRLGKKYGCDGKTVSRKLRALKVL